MGLCVSCRKSKDSLKGHCNYNKELIGFLPAKSPKICNQISTVVNNEENCQASCLSGQDTGDPLIDEVMAAKFSNMTLTNPLKGLVSKNRKRYKQDGFNLDLTYITDSIIAMGYPASNIESVYRNNIEDVAKFLDQKHPNRYMIYNLCSERSYDISKFHNMVTEFPFDDHNPPNIESVRPFCENVKKWLDQHPDNVAVFHCKAGKGRTGTMICCYLLHTHVCDSADQALKLYGSKRTQDKKGVTIPSQVRYVRYYEKIVNNMCVEYRQVPLNIKEFVFDPVPSFMTGPGNIYIEVSESSPGGRLTPKFSYYQKFPQDGNTYLINLDKCTKLVGDIKVEFHTRVMMRKEKLFHFWFNTFFVTTFGCDSVNGYEREEDGFKLEFGKNDLDRLNKKDKQHKVFDKDFKLSMVLQRVPERPDHVPPVTAYTPTRICTPVVDVIEDTPSVISSSGSDWDSGESTYL